jgi:hypothetical protein
VRESRKWEPQRARARRRSGCFNEISSSDFFTHIVFDLWSIAGGTARFRENRQHNSGKSDVMNPLVTIDFCNESLLTHHLL